MENKYIDIPDVLLSVEVYFKSESYFWGFKRYLDAWQKENRVGIPASVHFIRCDGTFCSVRMVCPARYAEEIENAATGYSATLSR